MATDNIFGIDPINTNVTAPVTGVSVQAPLDTSLETSTRSSGITNFTDAVSKLADKQKANAIHNDIITAEYYAAVDKEMEGFWEPEAQLAYSKAIDKKTTGTVVQQMKDFLLVEGSEMLSDDRVPRKERVTGFKNHLLGLLNTGKQSISKHNAAEMFSSMEAAFAEVMSRANVLTAKDKKQEAMNVAVENMTQIVKDNLSFMSKLMPKVPDVDSSGYQLSPTEYVDKLSKFRSEWTAKHLNARWFNSVLLETSRLNLGVQTEDIKATLLTIVSNELSKQIAKNPELLNQGIMEDILNNTKGVSKKMSLQEEINAETPFGKVVKGINDDFNQNISRGLKALDKSREDNDKARNRRIADTIQDLLITDKDLTKEQALSLVVNITDDAKQRAVTKHINSHFSGESQKDIGHSDFGEIIKYGAENFYDSAKDTFDTEGFYEYAGDRNFKTSAIKAAADLANPQTKRGKRRKEFFDQESVKQALKGFNPILKDLLEEHNLLAKFRPLIEQGVNLSDPIMKAKYDKLLGGGKVGLKIRRVLDAQIALGLGLESLIRNNPDKPVHELQPEVQKLAQSLIQDTLTDKKFGTSAKEQAGKEQTGTVDTTSESDEIIKGGGHNKKLVNASKPISMVNAGKGVYSTDKDARKDYQARAVEKIKVDDYKKKELKKMQEHLPKLTATLMGVTDDKVSLEEALINTAIATNPNPEIRRIIVANKLKKQSGVQTTITQPDYKLERPDTWKSFINFMKNIPEMVGEKVGEIVEGAQEIASGVSDKLSGLSKELFKDASFNTGGVAEAGEPEPVEGVSKAAPNLTESEFIDSEEYKSSLRKDGVVEGQSKGQQKEAYIDYLGRGTPEGVKKATGVTNIESNVLLVNKAKHRLKPSVSKLTKTFLDIKTGLIDDRKNKIWGKLNKLEISPLTGTTTTDALRELDPDNLDEGAHNVGDGIDIRATGLSKGARNGEANAEEAFPKIVDALTTSGYTFLKPIKDKKVHYVKILHKGGTQYWGMFTKDGEDFMIELVTGNKQPHIHLQAGSNYDTTRNIAKLFNKGN